MKKMKRFFAVLMAMAMVLGMSVTVFAAQKTPGVASEEDTATVSISNISGGATVTLYQIAEGVYGDNGTGLIRYDAKEGLSKLSATPTSAEINAIYQEVLKDTSAYLVEGATKTDVTGTYISPELEAGAYLAIISGATDDSVYNPVLLTVSYNEKGELVTDPVDVTKGYHLYGSSAVAKKTTPDVKKEMIDGTTTDVDDKTKETASVGDVITYQITPTMPSYPENATNKTFFFADTMSDGLTFDYNSLTISFKEDLQKEITVKKNGETIIFETEDRGTVATATPKKKKDDGKIIGFYLNFVYDALVYDTASSMLDDEMDGMMLDESSVAQAVYTPVITYKAVLNDKAEVGNPGNPNDAKMYYANDPNTGSTFEPTDDNPEPVEGETPGVKKKEDKKIVYTYELAFLKTGEDDDAAKLAGAVFGIYTDADCTQLKDVVKTNADGYAVSSKVEAGTYYIKELVAPTGYTLNDKVYSIKATWKTATSTIECGEIRWKYTTIQPDESVEQIGWIDTKGTDDVADDVFYALDEFGQIVDDDVDSMGVEELPKNVKPAYAKYDETVVTTTSTITTLNPGAGTAATLIDPDGKTIGNIPNTKLSPLPSTGGMGTMIFTVVGCLIMIVAAGFYFSGRKKSAAK